MLWSESASTSILSLANFKSEPSLINNVINTKVHVHSYMSYVIDSLPKQSKKSGSVIISLFFRTVNTRK